MRRSFLAVAAAALVVLPAVLVAACSSDTPAEVGATPIEGTDASAEAAPAVDATPPPIAQGDPCRGVPLPAGEHFVAAGMCANVVASAVGALRQITFAPNGDLFGVTGDGAIKRFHDADGDGFFQKAEITTYADTGGNGNNAHIDLASGYLYSGTTQGVKRWPYGPEATSGGAGEDVITGQPAGGHSKHTVHVYDGYVYVMSGSVDNNTAPMAPAYDDARSLIRRFALSAFTPGTPLAWSSGEIVTRGLRNANGFTRNAAGRIYAVVNGMDGVGYQSQDVHNDNPGEQVVEVAMGKQYGFPFCVTAQRVVVAGGQLLAPGTQFAPTGSAHDDAWCAANSSPPSTFVQAHSAPLDIAFFDDHPQGALPEKYRGGAFVALHGSWNRAPATGYKVVWIPYDAAGNAPMPVSTATTTTFPYEVILGGGDATGAKDGPWTWAEKGYTDAPRFAGVAISPIDGALYATTDGSGYLYRLGIRK